ncbi:TRAP-type C4-dicarboxylate transport system substrate-binding protein [Rhodoligotrophos appendicifer]|uniref:TRAP transporter substrate-binding protein n=1 Tax=Rhodoligotrophos appendicifer TaxID=987056 RepID=UPI0011801C7F|nr:TRAP transporter substrate-binding protein [Rhodoligotrophos appendicifer]
MKTVLRATALALALSSLAASAARAAEVVINYSNWMPAAHLLHTEAIVPWTEEVAQVTEGRVKINILPKVVGSVPSQYDVVRDGLADMALFIPGYTPGRFNVVSVGELPMLSDDPLTGAVSFNWFYETVITPMDVFKGVHMVAMFTTSPGQIFTVKKPVETLADMKGLKLRSPLATTGPMLAAMGAVPVQKPVSELYELLVGGILDGTLAGKEQVAGFKLGEVINHLTLVPGGLYNSVLGIAINEDVWARIDEADRAAITKISGRALAEKVGRAYRTLDQRGLEIMGHPPKTVLTASPEFVAEITAAVAPVIDQTLADSGLQDPAAVLADYKAQIAKFRSEFAQ